MRLLLDANVLLDCLILEVSGAPRKGSEASEKILDLCDQGVHQGWSHGTHYQSSLTTIANSTLPITLRR